MKTENKTVKNTVVWYTDEPYQQQNSESLLYHFEYGWPARQVVDGIYVTSKIYLRLYPSFPKKMTQEEAQKFCSEMQAQIPSVYEVLMMAAAREKVKKALAWQNLPFPFFSEKDIFSACWTRENITSENATDKKYVFIFGCDGEKNFPDVALINNKLALINQTCLYEYNSGLWLVCLLTLLAGDECSNLLLSRQKELFLLSGQKLSYCGKYIQVWHNNIIACNTGVFQYHQGRMHCLKELDPDEDSHNNANYGRMEWISNAVMENDGTELVLQLEDYEWCSHREQESIITIPLRYHKNEEGFFVSKNS